MVLQKKERDSNIELLRLVLMLMIVLQHVFDSQILKDQGSAVFGMQSFVGDFCRVAVNCFVFISGFYGIKLKLKSVLSLIIQALFYSWVILFTFLLLRQDVSYSQIIKSLIPISSVIWWFLTAYLGLMCISPMLNKAIDFFSKRQLAIVTICLLVLDIGAIVNPSSPMGAWGHSVFHFIVLYLIARYISKYKINIKKGFWIYFIPVLILFITSMILYKLNIFDMFFLRLWSNNNPLYIISAIGLFFAFKQFKYQNSFINKIAPLSFAIYLIHDHALIREERIQFVKYLIIEYQNNVGILFLYLLLFSFVIFVFCLCIEKIRTLICNPLIDKVYNKLGRYNLDIF